ncbi:hypothetical protein G5I_01942 [Acromyrmex echinatior]|uniref:Double jelly roll-like domain-containing protein n=1 Tax=Acromyrmex echinatior TaxID=103372 RepID=F4W8Z7_ACREC|nr:hypothetical protein G5I_01942 [Acromyrmex echinatior]
MSTTFGNNCVAFMFNEIRYELNDVEIDRNRNVEIISTFKNYLSMMYDKASIAHVPTLHTLKEKKTWKITSGTRTAGIVRPGRYFGEVFLVAAMRRMHRAARTAFSCQASLPRYWIQTIRGGEDVSRDSRVQSWNWSDVSCTLVHIGEYASGEYSSGNERSLVWRKIDAAFESRILTSAVINCNHIEPRRFLEDAGDVVFERVRDAVERDTAV